jgi:hypothetical protein
LEKSRKRRIQIAPDSDIEKARACSLRYVVLICRPKWIAGWFIDFPTLDSKQLALRQWGVVDELLGARFTAERPKGYQGLRFAIGSGDN